jgi:hypothetical protein
MHLLRAVSGGMGGHRLWYVERICIERISDLTGHTFHAACLEACLPLRCPICRAEVVAPKALGSPITWIAPRRWQSATQACGEDGLAQPVLPEAP